MRTLPLLLASARLRDRVPCQLPMAARETRCHEAGDRDQVKNLGNVIATPDEARDLLLGRREEGRRQDQVHRLVPEAVAARLRQGRGAEARHGRDGDVRHDQAGQKRQLTVNGLPAYTYVGDKAGVVKCDGVDGWHAVRPK